MKFNQIIPIKKEFSFVIKLIGVMVFSLAFSLLLIYLLLSKNIDTSFGEAFQSMNEAFKNLNFYILIAVLVQFIISTVVIFFVALFFSHKIAGPVYRLRLALKEHIDKGDVEKVSFRLTDFIPGISKLFSGFFTFLKDRRNQLATAESLAGKISRAEGDEKSDLLLKLNQVISKWKN